MECTCSSSQYRRIEDKTILVIEDDDSIGTMLVEALSLETSYKPVLVTDGMQALQSLHQLKPCLLITDYRLPHMDGIEIYDKFRSSREFANTPAILMSAALPENEVGRRQLISINKPFELDELLDLVERLLH